MGRYIDAKCKLCRREGMKLFLKGERCETAKCAIDRRDYPPGMHTWRRGKVSDYGLQLREKQKAKRFYGIYERQFRNYFKRAVRMPGNTGAQLLILLERRLDNVVCRLGFAASRAEARQIITHGHITINGRKVDIPSFLVSTNESIGVRDADKSRNFVKGRVEGIGRPQPSWLGRNDGALEGKVITMPTRDDVSLQPVHEQLIVELCSK
jgi:small subunit ribosomal protein S4